MNLEGKVERSGIARQNLQIALRCEHVDLILVKVEFETLHEFFRGIIALLLENLPYPVDPSLQFLVQRSRASLLCESVLPPVYRADLPPSCGSTDIRSSSATRYSP